MQVELQEVHKKICEDEILLKREDSSKNLFVEKFGSRINDLHQICQALRNDQQKLQTHAFSSTEDKSGLESIKQKLLHFETLLGSLNSASSNTNSPTHYYSKLNEISFSMESQRTQLNHLTNKLDSTFTTLVQTQSEINSTPRTTPCPSPTKSRRDTFNETRLSEISNSLLLIQDKISELTHKIAGTKVSETKLSGNHEFKEITKVLEKIEESKKFNQECITVSTNNLKNEISRLGKAHDEERNVESVERVFNGFKQDQAALNKNILESYMDLKNEIDRVRQVVSSDDSTKILDYLKELNMNIVPRVKSIEEDLYQLNHGFKTDMALYSSNVNCILFII